MSKSTNKTRTNSHLPEAEQQDRGVPIAVGPRELASMFGVDDPAIASRLLTQLLGTVHPGAITDPRTSAIEQALALVAGAGPVGTLEAMTVTLLIACQHASLDCMRRGMHPDQTPGGRSMYLSLGLKSARTYSQLLEALNHGRGKGVVRQEITVQHVTVEAGAQAIVGRVAGGRG